MEDVLTGFDLTVGRGDAGISLHHPVIASPMAGVFDPPYRRILHDLGIELSYTEMISSRGIYEGSGKTEEIAGWIPEIGCSAAQIFGSEPVYLSHAAKEMERMGHHMIDINAGCPKRKVLVQGSGGALIRTPERLLACLGAVLDSVRIPVSIKLRSGYHTFEKGPFLDLVKDISSIGVSCIALHPRTVAQGFRGSAERGLIDEVSSLVDVPVIASGDVRERSDVVDYLRRGARAVMVGRALMGDPLRVKRLINGGTHDPLSTVEGIREHLKRAREHLVHSVNHYGERRGCVRFRSHLGWYTARFPGRKRIRDRIFHVSSTDETMDLIDNIEREWTSIPSTGNIKYSR